jgi:muramoyltetrapeptide carboxypeptidase
VVDRLRATLKVPVLTGLPFGHVQTKVLLPVGAKVELAAEGRDVFMVWGHRHAHAHDAHHARDHAH